MQLRKNLNLYLSGIVVFMLTILLLSTAFALDESLGNRIAKIFWFYKVIIVAGIACIPSFPFFDNRPAGSPLCGLYSL